MHDMHIPIINLLRAVLLQLLLKHRLKILSRPLIPPLRLTNLLFQRSSRIFSGAHNLATHGNNHTVALPVVRDDHLVLHDIHIINVVKGEQPAQRALRQLHIHQIILSQDGALAWPALHVVCNVLLLELNSVHTMQHLRPCVRLVFGRGVPILHAAEVSRGAHARAGDPVDVITQLLYPTTDASSCFRGQL